MAQRLAIATLLAGAMLTAHTASFAQGGQISDAALAQFIPATSRNDDRLDWTYLDGALGWMVVPMGPSLRQGAPRVDPELGTRIVYGHESRLRLEGNRVAFSFLTPQMIEALGEYRADLERIGGEIDLARLPRNEQLAFWLNLHNVAVIEALAKVWPLAEPDEHAFGPQAALLHDAKLVTVAGTALSPRDIRERIVYPNWRDPKVIYGFWRGVIGGPSIQRLAYTGENVDALLALSGEEFVNSLRGVEAWGGALRVSPIYREAARFYFPDDAALRSHLARYAGKDVDRLLRRHERIETGAYEGDIADLDRGDPARAYGYLCNVPGGAMGILVPAISVVNCTTAGGTINPAIQRLMRERAVKLDRARRKGVRTGMVIYGNGEYAPDAPVREVE